MIGRRTSDWLENARNADERAGADRRAEDRRAPRRKLDPLFAATLVNQIAPQATTKTGAYPASGPRAGIRVNLRA